MKLIEAEALKNTIRGWIADIEANIERESDTDKAAIDALECVIAQVDSMTAIDAEPVKRGRWIKGENWSVTCSVCGCLAIAHDGKNYCPNCGAKMDLREDGSNAAD